MRLFLRLDPSQGHSPHSAECEFNAQGGFIGRSADCTWMLECPERLVSRRHAEIVFDDGCFWLVDNSANGVFHNDHEQPLGRGRRASIANGDSFRIGSFLIRASIEEPEVRSEIPRRTVEAVPDVDADRSISRVAQPTIVSPLRLAEATDAFRPPTARIPDDWAIELRTPTPPREVPALVVNRRLNALQRAASQALLGNLFPHDGDTVSNELGPEVAAAIGKSLRICLELAWSLRAEFDRVDGCLTGSKRDAPDDIAADVENFVRSLLQDESCALRVADLQKLATHLRGRHGALHDSFTESLTTIVEQFQPEKFEERLTATHEERGSGHMLKKLLDRLLPSARLWRFYRDWHEAQRSTDYRAVRQLFEKKVISVYGHLYKTRHLETPETVCNVKGK